MKRFNVLFSLMVVAVFGFMASCSSTDDTNPEIPTIIYSPSGSIDVEIGGIAEFTATMGSNEGLETFSITAKDASGAALGGATGSEVASNQAFADDGVATFNGGVINFDEKPTNVVITAKYALGSVVDAGDVVTIEITVIDKEGTSKSSTFDINATSGTATGNAVLSQSHVLGSHDNATNGSFYASLGDQTGAVYTVTTVAGNENKVDLVYFYGSSNAATLAAPNDADANTLSALGLTNWTTKNATTFKKESGVDATAFDAMTSDVDIAALESSTISDTKANQLAVGNVIAFETASTSPYANKKGLIKVTDVTGAAGTISIDVKMEGTTPITMN